MKFNTIKFTNLLAFVLIIALFVSAIRSYSLQERLLHDTNKLAVQNNEALKDLIAVDYHLRMDLKVLENQIKLRK